MTNCKDYHFSNFTDSQHTVKAYYSIKLPVIVGNENKISDTFPVTPKRNLFSHSFSSEQTLPFSLSHSLSLSDTVSLSLYLSLSIRHCLSLTLSHTLSLSFPSFLSVLICFSFYNPLLFCCNLFLSLSFPLSFFLFLFLLPES